MNILYICIIILFGVGLWVVSKWALNHKGRSNYIGAICGLVGTIILVIINLFASDISYDKLSIIHGAIQGAMYSIGFCVIILYALKIGPTGLTATIVNVGLIIPVLLEIFYFKTAQMTSIKYIALISVFITFLLLLADAYLVKDKSITKKWLLFVFIGWFFSGVGMSQQAWASIHNCDKNTYSLFSAIAIFVIMFLISVVKEKSRPKKHEYISGIFNGIAYAVTILLAQVVLKDVPANIYFPIVVASPIVFIMFLNQFVLKEKSSVVAWIAATFGIVGIILLSI